MESAESEPCELDRIAEQFATEIRKGTNPSVDAYVAQHGHISHRLRNLLTAIAMMEGLKTDNLASVAKDSSAFPEIEQLDDYKIVREIGRGGMGVVFEAIHQSLGRRVAIKVLATKLLGEQKHVARFRREARAAAKLRHTNIVPVFGAGSDQNHHYYVMDYIDGMSLQECLHHSLRHPDQKTVRVGPLETRTNESPTPSSPQDTVHREFVATRSQSTGADATPYFHWAAQVGAAVCDALHYAHSQGVLHRDLKPANLILDRQGEIWIADFGLAKLSEPQEVTMSGDLVGTPQYMSPESLHGRYDVTSEVYGVGLTLYELLTHQPAITGKSPAEVIRRAEQGILVPPRKLNPGLPRDLETIVLKSLAHNPSERYGSAGEMRDDLQRFLSDQPISARPIGWVERTLRWSRREPIVASLTGATFSLLLALALVSALGYLRTNDALLIAQNATSSAEQSLRLRTEALAAADQQRIRAESNLEVAVSAFEKIMSNLADRGLEPDAEFLGDFTDTTSSDLTPDDASLLQSLLVFFDQLAANNSQELMAASAKAARYAGDIYLRLGQLLQADRALTESLQRYQQIADPSNGHPDSILAQAEIMNQRAMIAGLRGKFSTASEMYHATCDLLESSDAAGNCREGRFAYARAHRFYASLRARAGLPMESSPRGFSAPIMRRNRPRNIMLQVRTEDELQAVAEAISVLTTLVDDYPDDPGYVSELARALRDRAIVTARAGRIRDSDGSIRESIELFERLLSENPDSDAIRYELAMTLATTDAINLEQMRRTIRANQLSATLLAKSPGLPRYVSLHAYTLQSLASNQLRIGRLESAEENLHESLRLYNTLVSDASELGLYETRLSAVLESIADLNLRRGDTTAAIDYLDRAIRQLQPWLRRTELSPIALMQLQRMKQKLSRLQSNS